MEGPKNFYTRSVVGRGGEDHGVVLAASGPVGMADIRKNLRLITEDQGVQAGLTSQMDLFAQEVRRLLIEGGAISYSDGKIDFGLRNSSYLVADEMLTRLREEWIIGLHHFRGGYDRRQIMAKPWRILVQPGINQVLRPLLKDPGHRLKFSFVIGQSKPQPYGLTNEHTLNEDFIGGALSNYAGILIPSEQFPRRISWSTLAKAAVLDTIPGSRSS